MRMTSTIAILAALAASPALAALDDWDTDQSGALAQEEWTSGLKDRGLFADWDDDGDGSLTRDEIGGGLFSRFDDDDDGMLSTSEWDAGIDGWYGEQTVDLEYSNWDENGDDTLSEEEFLGAWGETDLYSDFITEAGFEDPSDEGVGEDEFLGGLFDWFDQDDTGNVEGDEWFWNEEEWV